MEDLLAALQNEAHVAVDEGYVGLTDDDVQELFDSLRESVFYWDD